MLTLRRHHAPLDEPIRDDFPDLSLGPCVADRTAVGDVPLAHLGTHPLSLRGRERSPPGRAQGKGRSLLRGMDTGHGEFPDFVMDKTNQGGCGFHNEQ